MIGRNFKQIYRSIFDQGSIFTTNDGFALLCPNLGIIYNYEFCYNKIFSKVFVRSFSGSRKVAEHEFDFMSPGKTGLSRWWQENGLLSAEERFKDGRLHGRTRRFDERGNLCAEVFYDNGKIISTYLGESSKWTT